MEATITGLAGRYKDQTAPLRAGTLTIGRDHTNSLSFPDDVHLSRTHAVLQFVNGLWYCTDLGSTNGTYLDGERILQTATLVPSNSVIQTGSQAFRLRYAAGSAPSALDRVKGLLTGVSKAAKALSPPPAPVQPVTPPPVRPGPIRSGEAYWHGHGEPLAVHGIRIRQPLVFVGERLVIPQTVQSSRGFRVSVSTGEDPSLINPRLSVAQAPSEPLPYWPSYSEATPSQRFRYLEWLAAGRPSGVDQGYFFIFFYGLERFLLEGKGSHAETEAVAAELRRLVKENPSFASFTGYAERLLRLMWPMRPDWIDPTTLRFSRRGSETEFQWLLASLAANGRPFTKELAVAWLRAEGLSHIKRQVLERCGADITELFEQRFVAAFGSAMRLVPTNQRMNPGYSPANVTLKDFDVSKTGVCRAKGDLELFAGLQRLAVACGEEFAPVARSLKGQAGSTLNIKALTLLPPESKRKSAQLSRLMQLLTSPIQIPSAVSFDSIGEALSVQLGLPTRARLTEVADLLESLGFLLEPDPRFGTPIHKALREVLIAPRKLQPQLPTANYLALVPLASALVWIADSGKTPVAESLRALARVRLTFGVSENLFERLQLLVHWLHRHPQRPTAKTVEQIPTEARASLVAVLVELIQSDGHLLPSEVSELVRFGELLGIPRGNVLNALNDQDLTSILPAEVSSGFKVPPAPAAASDLTLNAELLERKLRESDEIARKLHDIFAEAADTPPVFVDTPTGEASGAYTQLLSLLTEPELSLPEYERLCRQVQVLPGEARTHLNERALDLIGTPVLEGDELLYIDLHTVKQLQHELANSPS